MTTTYVAIDLETTGLDPTRDAIIEVGVVTFRGNAIVDEFEALVNPLRDIPPFVSQLTGITDAMVADAPSLYSLRARLKSKLADHVIVGHNVEFDLGFLRESSLGIGHPRIDTVTLASILVPEAGRFNLGALADFLNFPPAEGGRHRALGDAIQTVELFLALRERALALSLVQLEEIVGAGRQLGWPETIFFEDVLAERARHAFEGGEIRARGQLPRLYRAPKLEGQAIVPAEKPAPLDTTWLTSLIQPGGHFGRGQLRFVAAGPLGAVELLLAQEVVHHVGVGRELGCPREGVQRRRLLAQNLQPQALRQPGQRGGQRVQLAPHLFARVGRVEDGDARRELVEADHLAKVGLELGAQVEAQSQRVSRARGANVAVDDYIGLESLSYRGE